MRFDLQVERDSFPFKDLLRVEEVEFELFTKENEKFQYSM